MRHWADPAAGLTVSSAGMQALVGHPMDRGAASVVRHLGIDPTRHRSRQFEVSMAAEADLVLTAERDHREDIIRQLPAAFRRVFTIKEFARIAPFVRSGDPREAVAEAANLRGLVPQPADPAEDDVADPYRRPAIHSRTAAEELTVAVKATLAALGFDRMSAAEPEPARPATKRRPAPGPTAQAPARRPAPQPRRPRPSTG